VTKNSTRPILLLLLVCAAALSSACLSASPLAPTSPLTVLGTVDTASHTVVEALIILSRGKHVVETTVPVHLNEFQGSLEVPVGQWQLTVFLRDADGMVHFQSKPENIQVDYGGATSIELILRPAASTVNISIDLENYVFRREALRARIYFDDQMYEVIRPDADAPFEAALEISPGSYEFKIELYTESFRVGDKLGSGLWQVVHIGASEEIFLTWKPETQGLLISGRVETLLPAPTGVTVTGSGPEVEITWMPVDHWNLQGYIVLAQKSALDRYELLTPSPLPTTSFLHALDPEELPSEVKYVVAAVSTHGLVGYYSAPQIWRP